MDAKILAKGVVIFLVLFISFGTNIEGNFIARMGLGSNYGYVIFAAMLITYLVVTNFVEMNIEFSTILLKGTLIRSFYAIFLRHWSPIDFII